MAKDVEMLTVRISTRWWFPAAARVLAMASIVLPRQVTGWIIDRLCERGVYTEAANA